jgi:glutamate dehydrogenase
MHQHPLHKEIIATQIANDVVHHMGLSFITHLKEYVGGSCIDIVQAYAVMIECFRIREHWRQLEQVTEVNEHDRLDLQLNLMRLGRRATRWFLRHHRSLEDAISLIEHVRPRIDALRAQQRKVLGEQAWENWQTEVARYIAAGCPRDVAENCVGAHNTVAALHIIKASEETGIDVIRTAEVYALIGGALEFGWITDHLNKVETQTHWQAMERDALLDEFMTQRGSLASDVLKHIDEETSVDEGVENWLNEHRELVESWQQVIEGAQRSGVQDFALYSMTSRKLGDLVRLL